MKIYYLGHSGFLIKDQSYSLLVDPWLSDGSFMNNWERFPRITVDLYKLLDNTKEIDLWCSHAHSDHYDINLIRELRKFSTTKQIRFKILSQDYMLDEYNKVDQSLLILHLRSGEWYHPSKSSAIKIFQIPERPLYTCHASLVVDCISTRFIHGNDSIISEDSYTSLEQKRLKSTYYSGQYSLVSPFPANQINLSNQLRKDFFEKHLNQTS